MANNDVAVVKDALDSGLDTETTEVLIEILKDWEEGSPRDPGDEYVPIDDNDYSDEAEVSNRYRRYATKSFTPPIWDGKQVAGGTYERGE